MSDRLDELRRQRALQREHLERIEREIAALEAAALQAERAEPPPIRAEATGGDSDAEAILQQYREPNLAIARRTKAGCFIYLGAALLILALILAATYLHSRAVGR